MKIGALRQRRLPVSSTGRGRRRCPCSASPVSAAGSGSATQPSTLLSESPCRCAAVLLRLAGFCGAGRCPLAKTGALRQTQLPVSSTGCGRCVCLLRLANFPSGPQERPCENWSAAPGCRCPNMQRGSPPACIFGRRSSCGALNMRRIRDDACIFRPLRQRRLPASSTGRGRRRCPCSASAVSAAGSASAAQPASPRCFCRRQRSAQLPPFGGNLPQTAPSSFSFAGTFRPALCGCCAACTQEEQSVARAPPGRARRAGGPLTGGGRDSIKTKTEQFVAKESSLQP